MEDEGEAISEDARTAKARRATGAAAVAAVYRAPQLHRAHDDAADTVE